LSGAWALVLCTLAAVVGPLPPVVLDDFETPPRDLGWREPPGRGVGWPRWGTPLGTAAASLRCDVIDAKPGKVGRVRLSAAQGYAILPLPRATLHGRPTVLTLRVCGDGTPVRLSANLLDASGEWLTVESVPVDFKGWRVVRLDLTRLAAHGQGDDDGVADPPLSVLSLNLGFERQVDGTLLFDDLVVQQAVLRDLDFLDTLLGAPAPSRVCLPEDPPLVLWVINRAASTQSLTVSASVGGEPVTAELAPAPGDRARLALRPKGSGPLRLEARLKSTEGERTVTHELVWLPPRLGKASRFFGLGDYCLDDLIDGRFVRDLPDLRAAGATWTRVRLARTIPEETLLTRDWRAVDEALNLAWAHGLRVVAGVPQEVWTRDDGSHATAREALRRHGGQLAGRWVIPRQPIDTETYDRALTAARERAGEGIQVLAELLAASPGALDRDADGVFWTPTATDRHPPAGPFPRALRLFADRLGAGGGASVWLWAPSWGPEAVTGVSDRAGATAVLLTCARVLPQVEALGWGGWRDNVGGRGLLGRRGDCRDEYVAAAVNERLLGGLEVLGVEEPAPGLFSVRFGADGTLVRVVWTERGAPPVTPAAGETCYDHLGRLLPSVARPAGAAPLYAVSPKEKP